MRLRPAVDEHGTHLQLEMHRVAAKPHQFWSRALSQQRWTWPLTRVPARRPSMLTITLTLCSRYNTTEQSSGGERGPHTQGRSTGPFQNAVQSATKALGFAAFVPPGGAQPPQLRDQVLPVAAHPDQTEGHAGASKVVSKSLVSTPTSLIRQSSEGQSHV